MLDNPDFARIAEACGGHGRKADTDVAFREALAAAFAELANRGVSVVSSASAIDPGWHEVILQMDLHHDPSAVLATLAGNGLRISVFEPVRASLADLIEGVVKRGEGRRA